MIGSRLICVKHLGWLSGTGTPVSHAFIRAGLQAQQGGRNSIGV